MTRPKGEMQSGLVLYVNTYTHMRECEGNPVTVNELIGSLLGVIADAIELTHGEQRRRLIKATHKALDDRLSESPPDTVN